jgi:hypothetical protein
MRIARALCFMLGLHLAGCTGQREIGSYTDFARLTFQADAHSVESRAATDGTAMIQFTRKYTLINSSPMPMHVRVPPLAVEYRVRSSVSQISQNDQAFSDIAVAFGEDRTVSLEPGEAFDFELTSSWFLTSEASPDEIIATFVFGLPEKRATGIELIGEVTAKPEVIRP